jgi:hypothetical protein
MIFLSIFNFKYPNQIQILILNFRFVSAKNSNNVIIIPIVYHIIIYFPCHLFIEEKNGSMTIFFLIFYFIFSFII